MFSDIHITGCVLVTPTEASGHGFVIEGPEGYLFDLGCTIAILAFNSLDRVWQFDTAVNDDGVSWQFAEPSLHKALEQAQAIQKTLKGITKFLSLNGVAVGDIDYFGILETVFEGCDSVTH